MKPLASIVQALQQASDETPFHGVGGFGPSPLEVAGIFFDDVAAFFRVIDFFELDQQLFPVGDQGFLFRCQLFEFFLDQIDNVGIRGDLIYEPHGRFDLAICRDDFLLHSFSFSQQVRVFNSGRLTEIFFDMIEVASAKKDLRQMIHDSLLDFFGA